jgi:hypothetical protein
MRDTDELADKALGVLHEQGEELISLRARVAELTAERDAADMNGYDELSKMTEDRNYWRAHEGRDDLLAYNLEQYKRGNTYRARALELLRQSRAYRMLHRYSEGKLWKMTQRAVAAEARAERLATLLRMARMGHGYSLEEVDAALAGIVVKE